MKQPQIRATTLAFACALGACASDDYAESRGHAAEPADASASRADLASAEVPVATDPTIDTIFAYLTARYDRDGDGAVSQAEYDRQAEQFGRWDRNEDGQLTAADFARPGGQGRRGRGGGGMSMGMTRRTIARYFQDDDDAGLLPLEEAQRAFARYDGSDGSDPDGEISEGEFTCAMEERHRAVPGDEMEMVQQAMEGVEPWSALIEQLDADDSATLGSAELAAFYTDAMETDTIDYSDWSERGGRRGRGGRGGRGADSDEGDDLAAQEGQPAPDFTLKSPDGKHTVTLSDHAGSKPVALIFGSYT